MSAAPTRAGRGLGSHRYALLFYTLLVTLAASPLLTALGFSADLLQIVVAFSLLVALIDVSAGRGRILVLLLVAIVVGLRIAPASTVGVQVQTGALVVVSALALFGVVRTIRFALRAPVIDDEHVYAALSAYLLAGLAFALIYWTVETVWPGSFVEAGSGSAPTVFRLSTAIYYSFVTLATLGYGDVVPRSEVARGLAVFEAVGGQLYIAVTIARLVSAQRAPAR